MSRVIWGDYSQIKGKHQSFGHFYIDAGQGLDLFSFNLKNREDVSTDERCHAVGCLILTILILIKQIFSCKV